MTKMNACRVALAMLLSVALSAQGRKTIEFRDKTKVAHYFDNAEEWKCGSTYDVPPVAGDIVQIAAYVNACTLYITNDTTLAAQMILVKGGYSTTQSAGTIDHLTFAENGVFNVVNLPNEPAVVLPGTYVGGLHRLREREELAAYGGRRKESTSKAGLRRWEAGRGQAWPRDRFPLICQPARKGA